MSRYNLALRAAHAADEAQLVALHQQYAHLSKGYAVDGVRAVPHITLCQLDAVAEQIPGITAFLGKKLPQHLFVTFAEAQQRKGRDEHTGFDWLEILVERDAALMDAQAKTWQWLRPDCLVHTGTGADYHPHLTLARIVAGQNIPLSQSLNGKRMIFSPALFACSANGECLLPK